VEKIFRSKHWYARSLTVVGKLFLSTLLVANLAYADNLPSSVRGRAQGYDVNGGLKSWFGGGKLPAEDQRTHLQAILTALNNLQNGEIAEWFNPYTNNDGQVRVVYTTNTGNGFCRVFQTLVRINGDVTQYQETACVSGDKNSWNFYK
jgi:surface antigen